MTDRIGENARLSIAVVTSLNSTRNSFQQNQASYVNCCSILVTTQGQTKPPVTDSRQSHSGTVDGLLAAVRTSCEAGLDVFSGGLVGGAAVCDPAQDRYRRSDGVCNNLNNKHWGATGIPLRRLAAPAYDNGKQNLSNAEIQ